MSKTAVNRSRKEARLSSTWSGIDQQNATDRLTREKVVTAAITLADRHGLAAVSIRRIAAELGSSAMALYHYVPTKRDLLNLMLDATCEGFQWPAEAIRDWREALSHFAWESRRRLQRHPWIGILSADDPEYGPECIRIFEALLTSLSRTGLDMRTAVRALGTLFLFVNGFVAAETASKNGSQDQKPRRSRALQPAFSQAVLATGKFPNVARFVETGAELPDDEAFRRALNWILNGMASDFRTSVRKQAVTRINRRAR